MYGVTYNKKMLFEREFPVGTIVREVSLLNPSMEPCYMYICSNVRKYEYSDSRLNGLPEIDVIPLSHHFFNDILFRRDDIGISECVCDVCNFEKITPEDFRRVALKDVREEIRFEKQMLKKKRYARKVMLEQNRLLQTKYSKEECAKLSKDSQNIIQDFERLTDDIKFYRRMLQKNKKVHKVLMKDFIQFTSRCEQIALNTKLCRMNQQNKKKHES